MGDIVWLKDYKGGGTMNNIVQEHNNIKRPTIYDVANYFIKKGLEENVSMTPLKIQKLCYYVKSFSLCKDIDLLKDEDFEAWIHGPANLKLHYKYISYYRNSLIRVVDEDFSKVIFNRDDLEILEKVFQKYGKKTGEELEEQTHRERPWIEARKGVEKFERSNNILSEKTMKEYYKECLE